MTALLCSPISNIQQQITKLDSFTFCQLLPIRLPVTAALRMDWR